MISDMKEYTKMLITVLQECWKIYGKSILAGMILSLGCMVYMTVNVPVVNAGLFSFGFLSIVLLRIDLYTKTVGYIKTSHDIVTTLEVLIGNFIGVSIMSFLVKHTSFDISMAIKLAVYKTTQPLWSTFIMAVFCGGIIYIISECYRKYKDIKAVILIILGVSTFILCGFEHSIANSFYFALAPDTHYFPHLFSMIMGNTVGALGLNKLLRMTKD